MADDAWLGVIGACTLIVYWDAYNEVHDIASRYGAQTMGIWM